MARLTRRREQLMNQRGAGLVARTEERVSLSFTIMEEMIIVPKKELPEVVQWYKGELTGNALLERAGRLSAQKETPLRRSHLGYRWSCSESLLSQALRTATKRLRQFPVGGVGEPPIEGLGDDNKQSSRISEQCCREMDEMDPKCHSAC